MSVPDPRIIDSPFVAERCLAETEEFPKLRSWLALYALNIPTLDGVILWSGTSDSFVKAREFATSRGYKELLVRSDAGTEVWPYPRGGFLVGLNDLQLTLQPLFEAQRAVWLHDPVSPLDNQYSINGLAWSRDDNLQIEIVGPGFDASDLKRGDSTPHERFVFRRDNLSVSEHTVISPDRYAISWQERLQKVSEMLDHEARYLAVPDPNSAFEPATEDQPTAREARSSETIGRLSRMGKTTLIEAGEGYTPIRPQVVRRFVSQLDGISEKLQGIGLLGEPLALSMSMVDSGRQEVYWDVVWPSLKAPKPS